ncbi:MAG: EamA family transporter [Thermodesulfobacteriota bacterium]
MTWFVLAFLTALAAASQDAWVKKWFSGLYAHEMFLVPLIYGLPLTLFTLLFIPVPALDAVFYVSFAASLPLNAVPFILYMKAIRESPLSLSLPYLAFTPVFMIGTGYVFLNELPNKWGIAGIAAVCIGSYVLNLDLKHWSWLGPFRAVFEETGSWIMLIVAFLFSFSSVIGKLAIVHSSVMFFQMSFFAALGLVLVAGYRLFGNLRLTTFVRHPVKGAVAGALLYCHILCHGFSIAMTKAAYMISVKRLSIVFGVIYGGLFFAEENIFVRLTGAMLMFVGAAVILLQGG